MSLERIFEKPLMIVIERAFYRIVDAVNYSYLPATTFVNDDEMLVEIASFQTAIVLLSKIRNQVLTKKYARAEAERSKKFLQRENSLTVMRISKELGFNSEIKSDTVYAKEKHVASLVWKFSKDEWVTQIEPARNNRVRITFDDYVEMLAELIKERIINLINKDYRVNTTNVQYYLKQLSSLH
ncbi:MAG: hypothetical protein ACP5IZ_09845 [Thermoprotei archaeon]